MHESEKWKWSRSVVSDPQRPHGLQPTRLLCPGDVPGKSNGLGCHCLLHQCSLVGRNSGCLLDSPGGTSLVVQWLGLYASTVDGGGGVTRVCSLIWELVSHTLLSVVKENRITWGTFKNSHSAPPHKKKKKKHAQLLTQKCWLCLFVSRAQIFFFLKVSKWFQWAARDGKYFLLSATATILALLSECLSLAVGSQRGSWVVSVEPVWFSQEKLKTLAQLVFIWYIFSPTYHLRIFQSMLSLPVVSKAQYFLNWRLTISNLMGYDSI